MRELLNQPRTIRQRFIFGNIFTGLLLLLAGLIAIWQIERMATAIRVLQAARERATVALEVHQNSTQLIAEVSRVLPLEDPALFETEVATALGDLERSHEELSALIAEAAQDQVAYPQMERVCNQIDSVIAIAETMIRQAQANQWPSVRVRVGVLTRDQQQLALETDRLVELAAGMEEEAAQQVDSATRQAVLYPTLAIFLTIALNIFLTIRMTRSIVRPIEQLTQGAAFLAVGALDKRVAVERKDELGQLADAFNQMADRLQVLYTGLEQRVAERTFDLQRRAVQLQTAAEVARDATTARELDHLLDHAVHLVRDRFGFYHAGIFLVDESGDSAQAVLRAATGEAGRQMLEHGHSLAVGGQSIVGYATGSGQPRIALDVGADAVHFKNPYLPGTRSEMALPLKVGEHVIGALDVQSQQASAFDQDDVTVLQTMADQLAMAIENARLLHEMQQALDDLARERNRLEATMDALPDLLFEVDREGCIYDFRAPHPEMLRLPPHGFIEQPLDQVLPLDVVSVVRDAINKAAESGRHFGTVYLMETPTGPGWFELSIAARENPDTPGRRFIALVRDITPRVRAEEALRESEERYRTILDAVEDGYYEVDIAGNFVFFNSALSRIFGYPEKDLMGMNNRQYMDVKTAQEVYQTFNRVYRTGQSTKAVDWEIIRKDGTRRFIEASVTLIRDDKGEAKGFRGIVRDVTVRKEAEEALRRHTVELEARNEELDAFAHTVAHDLKNPLGYMVGFAYTLEQEHAALSSGDLSRYLRLIAQNGRKMANIIDELLLLSSVRKVEDVEMHALDMAFVVSEAQARLADSIETRQAEIILPVTWPQALGYGPWVEEVWVNYLSNAIKYGGQPPRVELGADPLCDQPANPPTNQPQMIRFWVRDNGSGLTPDEQARLFTPFSRLDEVRAKGHGLGLSIVRRIVFKLGGQVGVESELGEGSTFWFTLPGR